MRIILLAIVATAVASCATARLSNFVKPYVGKDIHELTARLGNPRGKTRVAGEFRVRMVARERRRTADHLQCRRHQNQHHDGSIRMHARGHHQLTAHHPELRGRRQRRGMRCISTSPEPLNMKSSAILFIVLLLCGGIEAASAAGLTPPQPVSLDEFDGRKRLAHLENGESLAYIDMGNPAGAPVVLIHGYTDNARDWVPMLPYVSKDFRLILIDLRGHGKSSKPDCCYTRFDFAYDIVLLLDQLKIRRADVVGHSLGSIVAQTLAEDWPQRIDRVVLISSTGGSSPGARKKAPAFDFASQIRLLEEPIEPDSPFMIAWWDSPTPVDAEFIRRERVDSAAIPLRVWLAILDQSLAGNRYEDLQSSLPRLRAPTLLIWGSKDPIMEEPVRVTLRRGLPKAQVKIFDGLGHNPFWEQPGALAQTINDFLSRKDGSPVQ
jgi:pimeloyl-ACP methyl ester carboxylesterase